MLCSDKCTFIIKFIYLFIIKFIYFCILDDKKENRFASDLDEYGADTMSEINIVGRVILNIWRIMRHEVTYGKIINLEKGNRIIRYI